MWFGFIAISVIIVDVVFEFIIIKNIVIITTPLDYLTTSLVSPFNTMSIIVFVPAKRILNEWHTIISNKSIGSNCV